MLRATVVAAVLALSVAGCLGAFPPDSTGTPSSTSNGSGGGSGGGGSSTTTPADLGSPTDAAVTGGMPDLAGGTPGADMATSCIKLTTPLTDGHHNAGTACLGCHNGRGATLFTFAGTLYDAATNGATIAGATVEVIDAKGTTARIVTSSNGNFYSSQTLTPPFSVRASGCPNDAPMISKATGECNSSGCHTSAMRIHLP